MHLLLADFDDKDLSKLLATFFANRGYKTSSIQTSNILETCVSYNPDALLLYNRPSGEEYIQLCKELRGNSRTKHVALFVCWQALIDSDNNPDLFPPHEWEPDGHFSIPFDLEEAEQRIRSVVRTYQRSE
jgi:DNA-binding response OmpR family regulator